MPSKRLQLIVEGYGDQAAVPALARRVLHDHERFDVDILPAHRRGEWPTVKSNLDRFLRAAAEESASILCVLDFDCEQCIDVHAEEDWFREQAAAVVEDCPTDACFIVKEFESLFLWNLECLRSVLKVSPTAALPANPESVRDAKGELSRLQPKGFSYKPSVHQARLVHQLNLDELRAKSPSFQRFESALLRVTGA